MTRNALSLLSAALLLSCATIGCSNKGVELNKEASITFDPTRDQPKIGPGGTSENLGGAINKGKKPPASK